MQSGDHGTTYGGNLLACRPALYVLEQLTERRPASTHVRRWARSRARPARELAARHAIVPRSAALASCGVSISTSDAAPVVPAALERGLLVNRTPRRWCACCRRYVITAAEIDEALALLEAALAEVAGRTA